MKFLETVQEIKQTFNTAKTISGLSNISFGLPGRQLLNRVFLVLSLGFGMDAAILDPTDKNIMAMVLATEAMVGKDESAKHVVASYALPLPEQRQDTRSSYFFPWMEFEVG